MPGTRKLGKPTDQRNAMLRQQVTDFLDNGRMETTLARAKEIAPLAEKMITLGKKGDLHSKRQVFAYVTKESVSKKLFDEIAPKYNERNGGYTRIIKVGPRRGDAAEMALIEFVDFNEAALAAGDKKEAKKTTRRSRAKKAEAAPAEAPAAEAPAAEAPAEEAKAE